MTKTTKNSQYEKEESLIRTIHDRSNPYVISDRRTIRNTELSAMARFLLVYCFSYRDDWGFSPKQIAKGMGIGRDKVYKLIKELVSKNHAIRIDLSKTSEKGRFEGRRCKYVFFERSCTKEEMLEIYQKYRDIYSSEFKISFLDPENPDLGYQDEIRYNEAKDITKRKCVKENRDLSNRTSASPPPHTKPPDPLEDKVTLTREELNLLNDEFGSKRVSRNIEAANAWAKSNQKQFAKWRGCHYLRMKKWMLNDFSKESEKDRLEENRQKEIEKSKQEASVTKENNLSLLKEVTKNSEINNKIRIVSNGKMVKIVGVGIYYLDREDIRPIVEKLVRENGENNDQSTSSITRDRKTSPELCDAQRTVNDDGDEIIADDGFHRPDKRRDL